MCLFKTKLVESLSEDTRFNKEQNKSYLTYILFYYYQHWSKKCSRWGSVIDLKSVVDEAVKITDIFFFALFWIVWHCDFAIWENTSLKKLWIILRNQQLRKRIILESIKELFQFHQSNWICQNLFLSCGVQL